MFGFSLQLFKDWMVSSVLYVIQKLGYWVGILTAMGAALILYLTKGIDLYLQYLWTNIIPPSSTFAWTDVVFYFKCANHWLPIKEFVVAIAAIWAGKSAMIAIKLFVKLFIPGLG